MPSRSHSSANDSSVCASTMLHDRLVHPLADQVGDVLAVQHPVALLVDDAALDVQHVVVLEDVLADLEVVLLDALLRALDAVRQHRVLDRLALRHLQPVEDLVDAVAGEQAHDVVLGGQVEARLARVALAAGAAAQLVVDAPRLVALGAEHVQAARLGHALAELDVDTATGHVGRDRDRALLPGVDDDLGLALVLLGVEHVVRDALRDELVGEHLGDLDRDGADQHRLARSRAARRCPSATAANFSSFVLKTKSFWSLRTIGTLVGIDTTSSL